MSGTVSFTRVNYDSVLIYLVKTNMKDLEGSLGN